MNKREISIDDSKKMLLEGLDYFNVFCNEHNLKYYLAYGSLIGAIRHKGYIPWDDDIDLMMFWDDYEKLIYMKDLFENEDWRIQSSIFENQYEYIFTKVEKKNTILTPCRFTNGMNYGISIDIFPVIQFDNRYTLNQVLDIFNNLYNKYSQNFFRYHSNTGGINECILKKSLKKMIYRWQTKINGKASLCINSFLSELASYNSNNGEWLISLGDVDKHNIYYNAKWFQGNKESIFEGKYYSIPTDYDSVLKSYYGDYMVLPPLNERKRKHNGKIYLYQK